MTTTCLANPSCMPSPSFAGANGASVRAQGAAPSVLAWMLEHLKQAHARLTLWRQTRALANLDEAVLHDVGAPHWLKMRNQAQRNLESYEQYKAVSRLKY